MNKQQKYTPKYWIGHDPNTDDVYLDTANKSKDKCESLMIDLYFGEIEKYYTDLDDGKIKISLFEINFTNDE